MRQISAQGVCLDWKKQQTSISVKWHGNVSDLLTLTGNLPKKNLEVLVYPAIEELLPDFFLANLTKMQGSNAEHNPFSDSKPN